MLTFLLPEPAVKYLQNNRVSLSYFIIVLVKRYPGYYVLAIQLYA